MYSEYIQLFSPSEESQPTCLHYYRKECVGQLARRAGPNNLFACPECRKETVLPQDTNTCLDDYQKL